MTRKRYHLAPQQQHFGNIQPGLPLLYYTLYCLPIDISKDTYKIVFTIANEKKKYAFVAVREKGKKRRNLNR